MTPVRKTAALALTVLAFTALASTAACSSDNGADAPSTDAPTTNSAAIALPVSPVTIAILDPGSEPRAVVARTPAESDQQVTLFTSSTIAQQIGNSPSQDFSTPALTIPLTAATDPARGTTAVDLTLGAVTTPDGTLASNLGPTEGSGAGLTTDASGAVTALSIDPAPDSPDVARSAVEQALNQAVYSAVPFPAEPIGVGAQWTVTLEVQSAIALRQVTTATLRSLTDGVATVDVSVTQTPDNPVWTLPDGQGTLNIDSFVMTGQGSLTSDLSRPLPTGGTITVGGDQVYRDPNSNTILRQNTQNTVTWTS
ncbi:hypothetical protein [Rhodococcoides trifolii]|uniref:hypothetical protein n=1 Tax=Rhodococcoides trifolii TaxID=908250 RepID=UPI001E4D55A9|nr:hypothetical protein [Rhodococcus trifolii]